VWIVNRAENQVLEVDPVTAQKGDPITVGKQPTAIAIGAGSLWVANFADDTISRVAISNAGPAVTSIPVGDGPVDVAIGEGAVWVVNELDRTLVRVDPKSDKVVAKVELGNVPQRVAAGGGSVWVTVRARENEPATS
jgi:DNA-binding beta-propeller fold protein YncE